MMIIKFLQMGGYAIYVWPAYAVFFIIFSVNLVMAITKKRRVWRALAIQYAHKKRSG